MRVLFVSPEMEPLAKVGGLADVSQALPKALRQTGADVRVLIPFYGAAAQTRPPSLEPLGALAGSNEIPPCGLAAAATEDGIPVYFVVSAALYERNGSPYGDANRFDWPDNDIRFARLRSKRDGDRVE